MNRNDYLVVSLCSLLLGTIILAVWHLNKSDNKKKPMTHEEILYLKDSLEMEYYRRIVEESFFFDHSKIPNNESDTGIQSTRRP